jgi:hypothetical protein
MFPVLNQLIPHPADHQLHSHNTLRNASWSGAAIDIPVRKRSQGKRTTNEEKYKS